MDASPNPSQPATSSRPARVALVHDWLNQDGGAEVVLEALHDLLPHAPIFTTIFDPQRVPRAAAPGWDVRATWADHLPAIHAHHQSYLPLYPVAWSTSRVADAGRDFDLVLSNKSAFCHGARTGKAVHLCYCLTPTRFVWQLEDYLRHEQVGRAARLAVRALLPALKCWDRAAARRVHRFAAISSVVAARIRAWYDRDSTIIHPPVDVDAFPLAEHEVGEHEVGEHEGYWLVLARLVPYKRIDLAVRAFNQLGRRLIVVGDGRDRDRLQRVSGPTIELRGHLPRPAVLELLAGSRGLIWPGIEDYGLAPVEAMACGRPVVARRAGGVLDTVIDGRSGVFFDDPSPDALAAAVRRAESIPWAPDALRKHARRFGRPVFERNLQSFIDDAMREFRGVSNTVALARGSAT